MSKGLPASDFDRLIDSIAEQLSVSVDGVFDFTVRVDTEDETVHKLLVMVNLVLDAARRALQQADEAQLQLVQVEKMAALGRLVAGVCHELNTPIGAINSACHTMKNSVERLEQVCAERLGGGAAQPAVLKPLHHAAKSHQVVRNATDRIAATLERLRGFARLDEADQKVVDIHTGLDDTMALLAVQFESRAIKIAKIYGKVGSVLCHPAQLNQVFLHLLTNALHAIAENGEIIVETRQIGREAHISISDTGIGMSEEKLKLIFEPGFSAKNNRVGMGLGLPISYRIIKDHNGRILVESEEGAGSTFTVVVPVWDY